MITSSQVSTADCEQVALDQSLPYVVTANDTKTMFNGIQGSNFIPPQRRALLTASIGRSPSGHQPLLATGETSDEYQKPRCALCEVAG